MGTFIDLRDHRTPHYKRLMIFVDGTNYLTELYKDLEVKYEADRPPFTSLQIAKNLINQTTYDNKFSGQFSLIRSYWFSSYTGNDVYYDTLRNELRNLEFEPIIFKRHDQKEKGVDIALTKEMLVNAFNNNYDIALVFAGDADYVDLVHEVKRYGSIIMGAFFEHGLSPELRLAFDYFQIIEKSKLGDGLDVLIKQMIAEKSPKGA